MEKVLVLEDGQVNEYGVVFDQDYMNVLLEEYRKKYSVLRKGSVLTCGSCSKDSVRNIVHYFDDIASFGVASSNVEGCCELNFIGTINPVAYNLLRDEDGNFGLSNRNIHALLYWSEALEQRSEKDKSFTRLDIAPVGEFMGLDEKKDIVKSLGWLLEDVSLEPLGQKEQITASDVENAKVGARFVEKFGLTRDMAKMLKK